MTIATSSLVWTGVNLWAESKITGHTNRYWLLNPIDKLAPQKLTKSYAKAADFTVIGTGIAALLWLNQKPKDQKLTYAAITAENLWITWNLTQTTKMLVFRSRPYTRENGFVFQKKDDHYSFISGHSSMAACLAGTMIVMNTPYSTFKGQRALLYGSCGLALTTGILRVAAGKHFPTDVLSGFLVGMGVAYLNSKIHEN